MSPTCRSAWGASLGSTDPARRPSQRPSGAAPWPVQNVLNHGVQVPVVEAVFVVEVGVARCPPDVHAAIIATTTMAPRFMGGLCPPSIGASNTTEVPEEP